MVATTETRNYHGGIMAGNNWNLRLIWDTMTGNQLESVTDTGYYGGKPAGICD